MQTHKKWRSGFTLIEILVVLAVIAIVSSISFGAFRSVNEGNKRTSCQANLSQIYKSVRLYAQDYDGRFPYLNEGGAPAQASTPRGGIGLWGLYTFPKTGQFTTTGLPSYTSSNCSPSSVDLPPIIENENDLVQITALTGYVRSNKIFHCPADRFSNSVQYRNLEDSARACKATTTESGIFSFKQGNFKYINPSYLSYQGVDPTNPTDVDKQPYSSFRLSDIAARQLTPYKDTQVLDRPTRDMTILTWCRFHRSLDKDGNTVSGQRNFDNVLFSDGSVQSLPADQLVKDASATGNCSSWQRVPREKAENMKTASTCTPSP